MTKLGSTDGQGRQPLQATRLRLPLGGDLRRFPLHVRLRAARRAHAAQRQGRVGVARWCSCARRRAASTPPSCRRRRYGRRVGHLANFTDPLVDCKVCQSRYRLDKLDDPETCPNCGSKHSFTEARQFNLMFKTYAGPVEEDAAVAYLRPETAQGMFTNFLNVVTTTPQEAAVRDRPGRQELPQRDHAAELRSSAPASSSRWSSSSSCRPTRPTRWYEYWCDERLRWYVELGIPAEKLRLRPHEADELSHYSSGTSDVEFLFPWGWDELEGIANRSDYDLTQHAAHSGEKLDYFDQATNERYVPHVIEPAAGATRTMVAFLLAAYDEDEVARRDRARCCASTPGSRRTRWRSCRCRRRTSSTVRPAACCSNSQPPYLCDYDDTQSIGRRYRRQDEIGTPLARHDRLRNARRRGRHRPRPGHDRAGAGEDRRARAPRAREARLLILIAPATSDRSVPR